MEFKYVYEEIASGERFEEIYSLEEIEEGEIIKVNDYVKLISRELVDEDDYIDYSINVLL